MPENFSGASVTIGGVDFRITASNQDMLRGVAEAENRTRAFNQRAQQYFRNIGVEAEASGKRIRSIGDQAERASKQTQSSFERVGRSLERILALEALRRVAEGIINVNREAAQSQFSLDATFASGAARFEQIAAQRAAATGKLDQEYQRAAVSFGTLTKNYAFNADQVEKLIRVSENLAAVKGVTVVQAAERLQSAMRGEAEASEFLGLSLQSNAIKAFADMTAAQRQNFETLDQITRGQIIYKEALRQSGYAEGAAEARARTALGTYDRLETEISRLAIAFGKLSGPIALPFLQHTTKGLENIEDLVSRASKAGDALQAVAVGLTSIGGAVGLTKVGEWVSTLGKLDILSAGLGANVARLSKVLAVVPGPLKLVGVAFAAFEALSKLDEGIKELNKDYEALDPVSQRFVDSIARQAVEVSKLQGSDDAMARTLVFYQTREAAVKSLTEEQKRLNEATARNEAANIANYNASVAAQQAAADAIRQQQVALLQPFPKLSSDMLTAMLRALDGSDQRVINRFTKLGNESAVAFEIGLARGLGTDLLNPLVRNYIASQGAEAQKKFADQIGALSDLAPQLSSLEGSRSEIIQAEKDAEAAQNALQETQDSLSEFSRRSRSLDLDAQRASRPGRRELIAIDRQLVPIREQLADLDHTISIEQRVNFDLRRQELELGRELIGPRREIEDIEQRITDQVNQRLRLDREEQALLLENQEEPLDAKLRQLERAQRNAQRSLQFASSEGEVANANNLISELQRKQSQVQARIDPIRDRIEDINAAGESSQRGERLQQVGLERQRLALIEANKPLEARMKSLQALQALEAAERDMVINSAQEQRAALEDLLYPIERRQRAVQQQNDEINRQHDEQMINLEAEREALERQAIQEERRSAQVESNRRKLERAYRDIEDAIVAIIKASSQFDSAEQQAILARLGLNDRWKNSLTDVRREYEKIREIVFQDPEVFDVVRGRPGRNGTGAGAENTEGPGRPVQGPTLGPPLPGIDANGNVVGGRGTIPGVTPGVVAPAAAPPVANAPRNVDGVSGAQPSDVERFRFIASNFGFAADSSRKINLPPEAFLAVAALQSQFGGTDIARSGGNLFNIPGFGPAGSVIQEVDQIDPATGQKTLTTAQFQRFFSSMDSFDAFVDFLKSNPKFSAALQATDAEDFVEALANAGFSQDPDWQIKVLQVLREVRTSLQLPTPPRAPRDRPGLVPGFAQGGYKPRGTAAVVGETGPMMLSPGMAGYVLPNSVYRNLKGTWNGKWLADGGDLRRNEWAVVGETDAQAKPEVFVYGATSKAEAEAAAAGSHQPGMPLWDVSNVLARPALPGETPLTDIRTMAVTRQKLRSVEQRHDDGSLYLDTLWNDGTWTYELIEQGINPGGGVGSAPYGPSKPPTNLATALLETVTKSPVQQALEYNQWAVPRIIESWQLAAAPGGPLETAGSQIQADDWGGAAQTILAALPTPHLSVPPGGMVDRALRTGAQPRTLGELAEWDQEMGYLLAQGLTPPEVASQRYEMAGQEFSGLDIVANVVSPSSIPGGPVDAAGDLLLKGAGRLLKGAVTVGVDRVARPLARRASTLAPTAQDIARGVAGGQQGYPALSLLGGRVAGAAPVDTNAPEGMVRAWLLERGEEQGGLPNVSAGDFFVWAEEKGLPFPGVTRAGKGFPTADTAGGHPQSLQDLRELLEAGKPYSRWYSEFGRGLGAAVGPENFDEARAIFAITSAQTDPTSNVIYTLSTMRWLRELEDAGVSPWKVATQEDRDAFIEAAKAAYDADPKPKPGRRAFQPSPGTPKVGDIIATDELVEKSRAALHVSRDPLDISMAEVGAIEASGKPEWRYKLGRSKLDSVAELYATGQTTSTGAKTPSYSGNIGSASAAMYDPNATIDTWMMQALGYVSKGAEGNDRIYRLTQGITEWLANEQGIPVHEAQAAMWFPIKALKDRGRKPGGKYANDIFGQLTRQFEEGSIGVGDAVKQGIAAGLFDIPPEGTWDDVISSPGVMEELLRAGSTIRGRPSQGLIGGTGPGLNYPGGGPGSYKTEELRAVSSRQRSLERGTAYATAPVVGLDVDRLLLARAGLDETGRFPWLDIPHQVVFDEGKALTYLPGGNDATARYVASALGKATSAGSASVDLSRLGGGSLDVIQSEFDANLNAMSSTFSTPGIESGIEASALETAQVVGQDRFPGMAFFGRDRRAVERLLEYTKQPAKSYGDESFMTPTQVVDLEQMLRSHGMAPPGDILWTPEILAYFLQSGFTAAYAEQQREGSNPASVWGAALVGAPVGVIQRRAARRVLGRLGGEDVGIAARVFRQAAQPTGTLEQINQVKNYLGGKFGTANAEDMLLKDRSGFDFSGLYVDLEGNMYPIRPANLRDNSLMRRNHHEGVAHSILRDMDIDFPADREAGSLTKMMSEMFGMMRVTLAGSDVAAESAHVLSGEQEAALGNLAGTLRSQAGVQPRVSLDAVSSEGEVLAFEGGVGAIKEGLQQARKEAYTQQATAYLAENAKKLEPDDLFSGIGVTEQHGWVLPDGSIYSFYGAGGMPKTHEGFSSNMERAIGRIPDSFNEKGVLGNPMRSGLNQDAVMKHLGWVRLQTFVKGGAGSRSGNQQIGFQVQEALTGSQLSTLQELQKIGEEYGDLTMAWGGGAANPMGQYSQGGIVKGRRALLEGLKGAGLLGAGAQAQTDMALDLGLAVVGGGIAYETSDNDPRLAALGAVLGFGGRKLSSAALHSPKVREAIEQFVADESGELRLGKGQKPTPEQIEQLRAAKLAAKAEADAARAVADANRPPAPVFHSALRRRIEASMPEKTTAEAVGRMLQGSVSGNERSFSQIDKFLAGHAGEQVTRDQVLAFLDKQPLGFTEIARGFPSQRTAPVDTAALGREWDSLFDQRDKLYEDYSALDQEFIDRGVSPDTTDPRYAELAKQFEHAEGRMGDIREELDYADDPGHVVVPYTERAKLKTRREAVDAAESAMLAARNDFDEQTAGFNANPEHDFSAYLAARKARDDANTAFDAAEKEFVRQHELIAKMHDTTLYTKYDAYTLEGGKPGSYRELLEATPPLSSVTLTEADVKPILDMPNESLFSFGNDGLVMSKGTDHRGEEEWSYVSGPATGRMSMTRYGSVEDVLSELNQDIKPSWKHGHWDEENVLAWARFDERDIDGKRTLFVQELQSDWVQKGRDKGFEPTAAERQVLKERLAELRAYEKSNRLEWAHAQGSPSEQSRYGAQQDQLFTQLEMQRVQRRLDSDIPVPPITESSDYVDLMVKRLIRYAADNNYEQIAWTTGQIQKERWSMAGKVSRLEYELEQGASEGYLKAYRPDGYEVLNQRMSLLEVEEQVGAENAKKLFEARGYQYDAMHVSDAIDLGYNVARRYSGTGSQTAGHDSDWVVVNTTLGPDGGEQAKRFLHTSEAEKMAAELNRIQATTHVLNIDTDVSGGTGMEEAYDVVAKNIFEKRTGEQARMGAVNKRSNQYADMDLYLNETAETTEQDAGWEILDRNTGNLVAFYDDLADAQFELKSIKSRGGTPVHLIDVPEDVRRKSILEGYPAYAAGGIFEPGKPMMLHEGEMVLPNIGGIAVPHDLWQDLSSHGVDYSNTTNRNDSLTIYLPETLSVPNKDMADYFINTFVEATAERMGTVAAAGVKIRRR